MHVVEEKRVYEEKEKREGEAHLLMREYAER